MSVAHINANTMLNAAASPATGAFSVTASGLNRCAFAVIAYDNAGGGMSVTGVTYGGVAMTSCGTPSNSPGSNLYVEVWYLVNPPTGSNTLSVAVSGTIVDIYYNLVAFTGVHQTTPVRGGTYVNHTTDQATDGSGNYTQVISSDVNDLTLSAVNGGGGGNITTNQTSDGSNGLGTDSGASDHATAPGASVSHTWSGGGAASPLAFVGFSIQAAAGGLSGDEGECLPTRHQPHDYIVTIFG